MMTSAQIAQSIIDYAQAYNLMHDIQEKYPTQLPPGDQKTGSAGEFYAKLYIEQLYPEATVNFGGNSNKAWDISVEEPGKSTWYIQVKTTSAFSKYRKLSPIHHGWHKLFILHLNKNLVPDGFWVFEDANLLSSNEVLKECYAPRPNQQSKKSGKLQFGANKIADLHRQLVKVPGLENVLK